MPTLLWCVLPSSGTGSTLTLVDWQESIDIADYVVRAIEARRGAEQAGVVPQVEQLPIFGITKESLLALRYRLSDSQVPRVSRVQYKLQLT